MSFINPGYTDAMPLRAAAPKMRLSRPAERLKVYGEQLQHVTNADERDMLLARIARAEQQLREPFRITARDEEALEFLARMGSASSDQIARAVNGSLRGMRHRLKLLYRHGLVDRPRNQHATLASFVDEGNQRLIYALAKAGARHLAERGLPVNDKLDWTSKNARVMPLTLSHSVAITEAMLAFEEAAADAHIALIDQVDLPLPHATTQSPNPFACTVSVRVEPYKHPVSITNVPDRVFSLLHSDDTRTNYFLEVDRGTMDIHAQRLLGKSSFRKKQIGYFHFWKQGLARERFGFERLRVLSIVPSEKRIASMLEAQRQVTNGGSGGMFLYTTVARLHALGAFGPAWISADADNVSLLPTRKDAA